MDDLGERFKVAKASGSRFAYILDSTLVSKPKRFDIFKGNGWDAAVNLCEKLNKADSANVRAYSEIKRSK